MTYTSGDAARPNHAIDGAHAETPSQASFLGKLAVVLIAVLIIAAVLGIVLALQGP